MRYAETPEPSDELSPEERDRLIEELARRVVDRRLETPAIMFLEMHKPVSFLASQAAMAATPLLAPIFGPEGVRTYSRLLGARENVELIIRKIEDLSEERERSRKKAD